MFLVSTQLVAFRTEAKRSMTAGCIEKAPPTGQFVQEGIVGGDVKCASQAGVKKTTTKKKKLRATESIRL